MQVKSPSISYKALHQAISFRGGGGGGVEFETYVLNSYI